MRVKGLIQRKQLPWVFSNTPNFSSTKVRTFRNLLEGTGLKIYNNEKLLN
ncbi:hypothetical protein [Virgibacillus sp. JSM 102003]